jgi:hypothetical protein
VGKKSGISINTRPGADRYTMPGERIIEFSGSRGQSGLVSFREDDKGNLIVEPYRCDPTVIIRAGEVTG